MQIFSHLERRPRVSTWSWRLRQFCLLTVEDLLPSDESDEEGRIAGQVKVRMTQREFRELQSRTNPSDLGRVIVEEHERGRWDKRTGNVASSLGLTTIQEE
ncbi:hypothetical protein GW17_00036466 [Ensete ventricosum]|nr:hypothetical protein GW17_00036466 [Ensete ventricosum]